MATLTAQQQLKSVSKGMRKRHEKCPPKPKVSKVVLDNPFPDYWPLLNLQDSKEVTKMLPRLLVPEKEKPDLRWNTLKKLPKEERKQKIMEIVKKIETPVKLQEQRKDVAIGLGSVRRYIQNHSIVSCLVAQDAEPDDIVRFLVISAVAANIPIYVLPEMKKITEKLLSFSSVAIGLKVSVGNNLDSRFYPLHKLLLSFSPRYPVPKVLKRLWSAPQTTETVVTLKKGSNENNIQQSSNVDLKNVYLYRMKNTYRAFTPVNVEQSDLERSKRSDLQTNNSADIKNQNRVSHEDSDKKQTSDLEHFENSVKRVFDELIENTDDDDDSSDTSDEIYKPPIMKYLQKNSHRKVKKIKL